MVGFAGLRMYETHEYYHPDSTAFREEVLKTVQLLRAGETATLYLDGENIHWAIDFCPMDRGVLRISVREGSSYSLLNQGKGTVERQLSLPLMDVVRDIEEQVRNPST